MIPCLGRMTRGRLLAFAVAIVAFPSLATLGSQPVLADSEDDPGTKALEIVGRRVQGAMKDMRVVGVTRAEYPMQGRTVTSFKVEDKRDHSIHLVSLDRGAEISEARLEAEEVAAKRARFGTLDPALYERLGQARLDEQIPVAIWLKDEYEPPQRPDPQTATEAETDRFLEAVRAQRSAHVSRLNAPVVERLRELDPEAQADSQAPVLYATLSPTEVGRAAAWGETDLVATTGVEENELNIARQSIKAHLLPAAATGGGVMIGQLEKGGIVSMPHPFLPATGFTQDSDYTCGPNLHSTIVAGIIRSTDATLRGIAPGASLWAGGDCFGNTSRIQGQASKFLGFGNASTPRVINMSAGHDSNLILGASDRFYDNIVWTNWVQVVKSAGNLGAVGCPDGSSQNVTSPGLGYNVLSVGAYNDKNDLSLVPAMDFCSSFRNPSSSNGDREKPDLSAPGTDIVSTALNGGIDSLSGTSMAAPQVASAAAILIQRYPNLKDWPEGIRAILSATAYRNIEGSRVTSDRDGAGGIDVDKAYKAVSGTNGGWAGKNDYSCATTSPRTLATPSFTAGRRTRVAISWQTNTNAYGLWQSQPGADIDLDVIGPNGQLVASSMKYDRTTEIVDFTAPLSGTYTIRALRVRCTGAAGTSPGSIAAAWYNDPNS